MKIAIPVNEDKKTVCMSFGRTPMYAFVETTNNEINFFDNSAAASQGGAGIKAAQNLVDNKIEAVLTPRCGENASAVLEQAQIPLYKTVSDSLDETIQSFKDDKLEILTNIHPGFHNHGGQN